MDQQHTITHSAPTYSQTSGLDDPNTVNHVDITNDKQQYPVTPELQAQPQIQPEQQPLLPQGQPMTTRPGANYQTVTPLASLQKVPSPVDCPVCGVREMATVNEETGDCTDAMAVIACFFCFLGCIPT